MKKINLSVLIAAAAVAAVGGLWFYGTKDVGREEKKTALRIGVLLYRNDDTFIGTLRNSLEQAAKDYEKETGIRVALDVRDAKRNQITQNSQAERMIDLDCDVLCVNIVDRSAASGIIDKAMEADTPIVFFNREPVAEDMNRWEKLYYVGADAKESAVLEGQILVDAYKKNPSSLDRNGDGVVSYVLLEGETNHQDSLIRTEWSIQTLKDGGVPIRRITGGIANWEKNQASALMEQWLSEYGTEIELVIANNDDMALGAIDAIERAGIVTGTIKLVGIDGTPAGQDAFREGKLFGTVESSKEIYAKRIFDTAEELAMGKEVTQEKYFWSPQQMIAN
ncbi:galactose ABC transporter substrate-binding protein [Clostridium sp. AM30-24]|nr:MULTISPECIES: galactose ABC transporter substrate-binding protein [unclassified Clostridium]RHS25472.1 galactose ABC transporter substrate-binding protein [Clostridium sp. AF12-28]RHS29489.1 galactose ABC transporter substrate-binding protein [Clostridium sp. AF12-19]RHT43672.1 galactose ABC transporter substrate-binding protein [Clostridium sp. AM30-24]